MLNPSPGEQREPLLQLQPREPRAQRCAVVKPVSSHPALEALERAGTLPSSPVPCPSPGEATNLLPDSDILVYGFYMRKAGGNCYPWKCPRPRWMGHWTVSSGGVVSCSCRVRKQEGSGIAESWKYPPSGRAGGCIKAPVSSFCKPEHRERNWTSPVTHGLSTSAPNPAASSLSQQDALVCTHGWFLEEQRD